MRLTCPSCAAMFDLQAAVNDDATARQFLALVSNLGMLARPVVAYLALYRPKKGGLRWSRALHLARDLAGLIESGQITRCGTTYKVARGDWEEAIDIVVHRGGLRLPLKSNGYLLEVIAGLAEKRDARAEARHIEKISHQPRTKPVASKPAHSANQPADAATAAEFLSTISKNLGVRHD